MQHSAEIRWFYQETLPDELISWFRQPRSESEREDCYLLLDGCESVGVKIRGGQEKNLFEVKALRGTPETMQLPGGVSGRTDCWAKRSFDDSALSGWLNKLRQENDGWRVVKKERWLRKFSLDQSTLMEVLSSEKPQEGCNVELTRIVVGQEQWWSFAFEAFGKPECVQENLRIVANHFFSLHPPVKGFRITDSWSYPAWLARNTTDSVSTTPDPRVADFHQRAGQSHAETRKLLTAMTTASFGVLYATLTSRSAPLLHGYNKWLALAAMISMGLAAVAGIFAWRADARWAYEAADNFKNCPGLTEPVGGIWHERKKQYDRIQIALFFLGLLLGLGLTIRLL